MFSNSQEGMRGLCWLFDLYSTHRKTPAGILCEKLGIPVLLTDIPLFRAYLYNRGDKGWSIEVSQSSWLLLQHMLMYHELAHYCLFANAGSFFFPSYENQSVKAFREIEYWCDGFATAMLFSCAGIELLTPQTYQDFLTGSADMLTPVLGTNEYQACLEIFQGERIVRLSEEKFLRPNQELRILGKTIVHLGEQMRANRPPT